MKRVLAEILAQAEADFGVPTPEFTLIAYRDQNAMIAKKAAFEGVSPATMAQRFWCDFCGETDFGAVHARLGSGWFDESGFPHQLIGRAVLAHEIHHAFQAQTVGRSWSSQLYAPEWMTEGAAHYWAYRTTSLALHQSVTPFLKAQLPSAKADPITLKKMENRNGFDSSTSGPYNYSLLAVYLLMSDRPSDTLIEFWTVMSGGVSWQSAFTSVFGITPEKFYEQFDAYLSDSEHTLSGTMTSSLGAVSSAMSVSLCLFDEPTTCSRVRTEGNLYSVTVPSGVYILTFQTGSVTTRFHGPNGTTRDRSSATKIDLTTSDVTGFNIVLE